MSDRKSEIIKELESHIKEVEGLHYTKIAVVNDLANSAYKAKRALEESPRIIRTVQELEALDRDAVLVHGQGLVDSSTEIIHMIKFPTFERPSILPAVVLATGAQVRAAREAMEQEYGAN